MAGQTAAARTERERREAGAARVATQTGALTESKAMEDIGRLATGINAG
jgi:hypothetical protein